MTREDLFVDAVVGAVLVALVALVAAACFGFDAWTCRQWGRQTAVATRYRVPSGCFARVDGRWVARDQVRVVPRG